MTQIKFTIDFPTEIVEEGKVKILVPKLKAFMKSPSDYAPSKAPVFYNPVMELNRDMAVLAFQAYQKLLDREMSVCEPLTSCGIRGVRFAAEIEDIKSVVINDISERAVQIAKHNVQITKLEKKITVKNQDANALLGRYSAPHKRFDAIDIDPFGSPAPYIDSAIRALRDGGLLALTATDMAPLCGVHPKACIRKYGGKPLRTEYCHELALRLLIGCLASVAAKHDVAVSPVFSYRAYNHVRTYVVVSYSAKQADRSIGSMGYILHCFSCLHREYCKGITPPPKWGCPECGSKLQIAGPLWLGPLWNDEFCIKMKNWIRGRKLRNEAKIHRMITLVIEEAEAPITYYVVDKLCDKFNLPVPPLSKV